MNTLIDKIRALPLVSQIRMGNEMVPVEFSFNSPSSLEAILAVEKKLGRKIPEEYRLFFVSI